MNENTQALIDNFLQECKSVDIFSYTLGVFIAHLNHNQRNFTKDFYIFNGKNGVRFSFQNLPNNMVAISEK